MTIQQKHDTPGYYALSISSIDDHKLLYSNNERAFIIAQLQDLLTARSILEISSPHHRLAAHIDLLAFSIQDRDIRIIAFAISPSALHELSRILSRRLRQYQGEYGAVFAKPQNPVSMLFKLTGPHHALLSTVAAHIRHKDWEYDRYSSIGFYLHDRRGDWMRPWRLTSLFENNAQEYRSLIESNPIIQRVTSTGLFESEEAATGTSQPTQKPAAKGDLFDSSSHE